MVNNPCLICKTPASTTGISQFDGKRVCCPRCGDYMISYEAEVNLRRLSHNERQCANASGWIREHQNEIITSITGLFIEGMPTPSIHKRAVSLLKYIEKETSYAGEQLIYSGTTWLSVIGVSSAINSAECLYVFHYLLGLGYLRHHIIDPSKNEENSTSVSITPAGYLFLEQLKNTNPDSQIGFCAMWFDESINFLWDKAIEPAIGDAGYQPLIMNRKEHINRIDDEIFADIRRSRFVVADFTHGKEGVRGGVYFEAGFAQGLGIPVIWTCREDMLSEDKLHFDIRQYNFLEWANENLDDFKNRLQKRIEAILGRGAWKPNT